MKIEFDNVKNAQNIAKHGISFEAFDELDWSEAVTLEDDRFDYGEIRNISYVMYYHRLHILVWTLRGDAMRLISLRKANQKEEMDYEKDKDA